MNIIAQTDDLIIREFNDQDLLALILVISHPDVMKFSCKYKFFSMQKTKEIMQSIFDSYEKNGWGLWALVSKDDDVLIGFCGLTMQQIEDESVVELEYCLAPDYYQSELALQAVWAVGDYACNTLGMSRLVYIINPENSIAIDVAQQVGLVLWKKTVLQDNAVHIYRFDKR